jgi:DNA repair exonuclease SbcCD nuclease subunit
MIKIAHLADLHIGYSHLNNRFENRNQRLVDFEQSSLLAAENIIKQKADLVVIAGDLIHETNLYPSALSGAVKFCQLLNQASIPVIAIGGNHDEAEAENRYNTLSFLAEHHNLKLFLKQDYLDINGLRLHLVSYRILSRAARSRGEIQPFQFATDKPNLLVAHGYASGDGIPDIPEDLETVIPEDWLNDQRFSLIMLGHVHHHGQIRDRVFYAGSTERRNFGEFNQRPGYYIHSINETGDLTDSKSVFIDQLSDKLPRPMQSFELDTSKMTVNQVAQYVEKKIDQAPSESMLRIVLQNVSPELDRSQLRLDWERRHKKNGGLYFEATVQTRRVSELLDIKFKDKPKDLNQGIIDFIKDHHIQETDKQSIISLASEIIAEAQERVLSEGQ